MITEVKNVLFFANGLLFSFMGDNFRNIGSLSHHIYKYIINSNILRSHEP